MGQIGSTYYKIVNLPPSTKDIGMHIDNKVVHSISGPISMGYLVPNHTKHNYYRPPILLFGDLHFSTNGSCNPCTMDDKCYPIHYSSFYKLFDKKGVDMYVEVFVNEKLKLTPMQDGFDNGSLGFFIRNFKQCFPFYGGDSKAKKCHTNHIRYHASDARFGTVKDGNKNNKNASRQLSIEKMLMFPQWVYANTSTENHMNMVYRINNFNPSANDLLTIRTILKNAFRQHTKNTIILSEQNFVDNFFDAITINNSLIAKQLAKQPSHLNLAFWKNVFVSLIQNDINASNANICKININTYNSYIKHYGTSNVFDIITSYKEKESITNIFTIVFSSILDLYTLMRIFKHKDKKDVSYFTMGYFGHAHSISIGRILVQYFGYDIRYYEPVNYSNNSNDIRCIKISHPIDIDQDIANAQQSYLNYTKSRTTSRKSRTISRKSRTTSRTTSRKSRTTSRKVSRTTSRKSRTISRKSRTTSRKSRTISRKSRTISRKSRTTSRKSRTTSRKSRTTSRN